ncbi:MAG: glycosyltransferase family 2 protein [Lachnospiraceae bacterium]|nr:glycosyltransferase family 2 protein [Lachnospiraceae bacterium]
MDKIHLIMPMGGGGTRFGNKGFNVPKPLIMLRDKPFFYWAAECVRQNVDIKDIEFVVLKEHIEKFNIDKEIKKYYPDAKIHVIPEVLKGAVLTCLEGLKEVEDDLPILFEDCDHAFLSRAFFEFANAGSFGSPDAALLTFDSDNPAYSYARFDEEGRVIGTVEKQVVSNEAICGAYYFKNAALFKDASDNYLKNCAYNEFFVSGVYNELVKSGKTVSTFPIDEHISFGTPDEYDASVSDERLGDLIK